MFGPPRSLTRASTCPWIDRRVSGLQPTTGRPIQTRFRFGFSYRLNLAADHNSLAHYAKGTRSHVANGHSASTACKHTVSGTISLPSQGYFSPFPHGTCSLSVTREYLALEDGPPRFRQDSTCPALLGVTLRLLLLSGTGLSPSLAGLSRTLPLVFTVPYRGPTTPQSCLHGLG